MSKNLTLSICVAVLSFVAIEIGLNVARYLIDAKKGRDVIAFRRQFFRNPETASRFEKESSNLPHRFDSYLIWRKKSKAGTLLNLDDEGTRRTWNPETGVANAKQLWMFGGSTLWGADTIDDETIPSWLSKRFADHNVPARITNFGEGGYVSTQEMIQLILLLKAGKKPDVVIFYDGVNDILSAQQSQRAGEIQQRSQFEDHIYRSRSWIRNVADPLIQYCQTYHLYRHLRQRYASDPPFGDAALASDVVQKYLENVAMIEQLATAYGFKVVFIWQPVIFLENRRLPQDAALDLRANDTSLRRLTLLSTELLKEKLRYNTFPVHIISDALSQRKKAVYLDYCHISGEGNRMVSEVIYPLCAGL